MSYDDPNRMTYTFGPYTFTADETFSIQGPKGKKGRLWDYGVYGVTTAFAGATTTPQLAVGTPSDQDAYGNEFDFGTLADNSGQSVRSTYYPYHASFDDYLLNAVIDADQEVVIKAIGATGGGAAGVANFYCIIDWEK